MNDVSKTQFVCYECKSQVNKCDLNTNGLCVDCEQTCNYRTPERKVSREDKNKLYKMRKDRGV